MVYAWLASCPHAPSISVARFFLIKAEKLPKWAKDMEIKTWASFFLKYIISHKAVTCAIPATTQIAHMIENMEAMHGYIPTQKDRKRMENFIQGI